MDLEVQADEMSSCTTAAATAFAAGSCWGPSPWGILNHAFQPVLESNVEVQLDVFSSSVLSGSLLILLCNLLQRNNTGIYLFQVLMKKSDTRGHFFSHHGEQICTKIIKL
jgi:hypothetical protein